MTRSVFDPNSGETERSGSRYTGPEAEQISQLPPEDARDTDLPSDNGETGAGDTGVSMENDGGSATAGPGAAIQDSSGEQDSNVEEESNVEQDSGGELEDSGEPDNSLEALAAAEKEVESEHAAARKAKFTAEGEALRTRK